jgi:hypothetical protein
LNLNLHRHWESVALGTIPISNVEEKFYRPFFGDSMLYMSVTSDMVPLITNCGPLAAKYWTPNRALVSTAYWEEKVFSVGDRLLAAKTPRWSWRRIFASISFKQSVHLWFTMQDIKDSF